MQLTAQYSNHMRLGQGFNSYTHETRIDNAVILGGESSISTSNKTFRDSAVGSSSSSQPSSTHEGPEVIDLAIDGAPPVEPSANGVTQERHKRATQQIATKPTAAGRHLTSTEDDQPFHIVKPVWDSNQSVTYSSWQVDSLNDVADALNISSFARVKYATVEANVNAAMIHENAIGDSQLNYIVSVKVTNDSEHLQEPMKFSPVKGLDPGFFTQVYGDCFISGFLEGGELTAIISIKVNDKSKLRSVKEAVDFTLSVPPVPGLDIGAGEKFAKSQNEAFHNTETTISVRCNGGGVIKKPGEKWTLNSVVAIANAFPSLVAGCPSKTSAILTKYTSLKSFQEWMWKMKDDPSWKRFVEKDDHFQDRLILSYAPCHIYTSALYDDLVKYKSLRRRIKDVMTHPTRYKPRTGTEAGELPEVQLNITPRTEVALTAEPAVVGITPIDQKRVTIQTKNIMIQRGSTFGLMDPDNPAGWELAKVDDAKGPLPVDVATMKKADLLCRAAMTLITEEAARLVNHPHLAYAEFDDVNLRIRINKPNYPVPELLEQRLPVFSGNDATDETLSDDAAVILTMQHAHGDDLYFHLIGDVPHPHRKYKTFSTLEVSDPRRLTTGPVNRVKRISIHAYRRRGWNWSRYGKASDSGIGALGFTWMYNSLPKEKIKTKSDGCTDHFGGHVQDDEKDYRTADINPGSSGPASDSSPGTAIGIARIDVQYCPGDGRIASLTFYESPPSMQGAMVDKSLPVLTWRQWDHDGSDGRLPEGLKTITQSPPQDDSRWAFVGICGAFDDEGLWRGRGKVLARVSGVWRKL